MKNKNPLYVVKKDHIEEADNLVDMLVKKFNLEPVLEILMSLLQQMLEMVSNFEMLVLAQQFIDDLLKRVELFKKFSVV